VSRYVLPSDGEPAWTLAQRWERCSPEARQFAALHHGRFGDNILPHVIAELYDKDWLSAQLAAGIHDETWKETNQ
jgi:hypothetical protein